MSRIVTRAVVAGATFLFSFNMALAQTAKDESGKAAENAKVAEKAEDKEKPAESVLDQITIYGNRQESTVLEVPANITVIDGEKIDDRAITDMKELVRDVPGVEVFRQSSGTDPFNSYTGFTIRGVGQNRVQLLVDGGRIPERITDGRRDYFDFNFTKQVDVVRGPGSVLWGSDALGGIVAVETIDPEDLLRGEKSGGEAEIGFSSFDNEINTAASYAYQFTPQISVLGGLSHTKANEPELSNADPNGGPFGSCPRNLADGATPCNEFDPTDKQSFRGLGKVVIAPTGKEHRLELIADYLHRDTDVDFNQVLGPVFNFLGAPTGDVITDFDRNLETQRQRYALEHKWNVGGSFISDVKWSVGHSMSSDIRSGTESRTAANNDLIEEDDLLSLKENFTELDIQLTSKFDVAGMNHLVTWGFDGDRATTDYERVDTVRNLTSGAVTVTRAGGFNFANATTIRADVYAQDQIELFDGRLEITPGVRVAYYNLDPRPDADYQVVVGSEPKQISNTQVLYALSADLNLTNELSVYAAFSQGFKMPTSEQLYTSLPGAFFNLIPNPDLRPESVNNYEVGLRGEFEGGFFSVNGFYADYKDFIQAFVFQPNGVDITFENLSSVDLYGIEASGGYEFMENLTGDFTFAWQQGIQKANPNAAEQKFVSPPVKAVVGLTYVEPEYNLALEAVGTAVGKTTRVTNAANFQPHGYALLDLYARWKPTKNSQLRFGIKNVFDKAYYDFGAANTNLSPSDSVRRVNPIELQRGAGRVFEVSYKVTF